MKKYEMIDMHMRYEGVQVSRIRALRDFGNVRKGDIGGFIEDECNLSHHDDCWVYGRAIVCGFGAVFGNARIVHSAVVKDNATVYGDAIVRGNTVIDGHVSLCTDQQLDTYKRYKTSRRSTTLNVQNIPKIDVDIKLDNSVPRQPSANPALGEPYGQVDDVNLFPTVEEIYGINPNSPIGKVKDVQVTGSEIRARFESCQDDSAEWSPPDYKNIEVKVVAHEFTAHPAEGHCCKNPNTITSSTASQHSAITEKNSYRVCTNCKQEVS